MSTGLVDPILLLCIIPSDDGQIGEEETMFAFNIKRKKKTPDGIFLLLTERL